jgi:ADP-ribosyl-[dinitrogen reductase] hydrolase
VAAITGSLLGAYWGATAVPHEWRRPLHGRLTYHEPALRTADLDRHARLASNGTQPDKHGWPGTASMGPHYKTIGVAEASAVPLTDRVTIGNVHAVADQVREVDAIVSLCRMGTNDVPADVEHHVIGLLDTDAHDNPNLDFVLADTADLVATLAGENKQVFVHCVEAQNRTPALAAAYLVRHDGLSPTDALDQARALLGRRPQDFLADAVLRLSP